MELKRETTRFVPQVAATLEAARVWRTFRDPERTIEAYDEALEEASTDPALSQEEIRNADVLSANVLKTMAGRLGRLWDGYQVRISEVGTDCDAATDELVSGVYRELDRIRELAGSIPTKKMAEWWEACARF